MPAGLKMDSPKSSMNSCLQLSGVGIHACSSTSYSM